MYILNFASVIKKVSVNESRDFLKTVISELDFLRKTVIIQFNI